MSTPAKRVIDKPKVSTFFDTFRLPVYREGPIADNKIARLSHTTFNLPQTDLLGAGVPTNKVITAGEPSYFYITGPTQGALNGQPYVAPRSSPLRQ